MPAKGWLRHYRIIETVNNVPAMRNEFLPLRLKLINGEASRCLVFPWRFSLDSNRNKPTYSVQISLWVLENTAWIYDIDEYLSRKCRELGCVIGMCIPLYSFSFMNLVPGEFMDMSRRWMTMLNKNYWHEEDVFDQLCQSVFMGLMNYGIYWWLMNYGIENR